MTSLWADEWLNFVLTAVALVTAKRTRTKGFTGMNVTR